ncbi:MAG TPA: hypothetical protein PLS00_07350 [Niabella sp.]|nr:hypothetical protein [Agriterribacter sp.]HUN02655.1 hypothetical protein [Niabella sp.]
MTQNRNFKQQKQIRIALSEHFGLTRTETTVSRMVQVVKNRYPEFDELEIKRVLSQMNGWNLTGNPPLTDGAEILPDFFEFS